MTEREEFEAWWKTFDFHPDESELDKDPDGYYFDTCTGRMWKAWQAAKASQWISVDERLPSTLEPVVYLRKADNGLMSVGVAYWTVSDKWNPGLCSKHQPEGFTHWMPLPEPPK